MTPGHIQQTKWQLALSKKLVFEDRGFFVCARLWSMVRLATCIMLGTLCLKVKINRQISGGKLAENFGIYMDWSCFYPDSNPLQGLRLGILFVTSGWAIIEVLLIFYQAMYGVHLFRKCRHNFYVYIYVLKNKIISL